MKSIHSRKFDYLLLMKLNKKTCKLIGIKKRIFLEEKFFLTRIFLKLIKKSVQNFKKLNLSIMTKKL